MPIEKINQGDQLSQSADLVNDNIDKLKMLFPEIVTEGRIDFKALQQVLGEELEEEEEYYRFTWAGKSQARREAHKPSTGTLRPAKEESLDWDTTQNMYIEGDNLEVLKLLQKSYAGKVKMIYIDPPYNTGKDFVYKDNYKDNLKNYQEVTGQIDSEGNKTSTNSDSDGRYHSNWLNMMYPRLRLARNLLKDDGVIFMSIDDNELENLKKVGNEIFGEENFVANIIWRGGKRNAAKWISNSHEYMVFFAKNISYISGENVSWKVKKQGLDDIYKYYKELKKEKSNDLNDITAKLKRWFRELPENHPAKDHKHYSNVDKLGIYCFDNISRVGGGKYEIINPNTGNIVTSPSRGWVFGKKDDFWRAYKDGIIEFNDDNQPYLKRYLKNNESQLIDTVIYKDRRASSKLLRKLLGGNLFDFPKDIEVLKFFMSAVTNSNDLILDFFSGSASSAESVMQLNLEDGRNRKHIQVQLPEKTEEKSEAFKSGYKTITEIGKERIRRVVKKIKEGNPEKSKEMDLGFKVFKLDSSNIKSWDGNPENLNESLFDAVGNIKTDRTEEDVLYEILLKYGLDLTLPIEERIIEGKKVFNVGLGSLFICLSDNITAKVAEGIGQWKEACSPEICRVIFKDNGFTDVEKTNSVQTLKRYGINEIRSI